MNQPHKERPILFSGPMVRAILEGKKTQTRRLYKPRHPEPYEYIEDGVAYLANDGDPVPVVSPYGAPGERLWVRETWAPGDRWLNEGHDLDDPCSIRYQADNSCRSWVHGKGDAPAYVDTTHWSEPKRWRPSIHMPRWASRLALEVTGVKVERLQEISEKDAKAEGAQYFPDIPSDYECAPRWSMERPTSTAQCLGTARFAFANLWNKTNPKSDWDSNPYVWAISFKRLEVSP